MKLSFGPGVLVAAAFIGPGTVTTCTLAGAQFGFALVWALVFATIATIVLQDMTARLGAGARLGLGEALLQSASKPLLRFVLMGLVIVALFIGNCAYESGNLSGGALGLEALLGDFSPGLGWLVSLLAGGAGIAIAVGKYDVLEKFLILLVMIMSAAFAASVLFVRPDFGQLAAGFVPSVPHGAALTTIALIGTTIVPYNLFLHAAASREKWAGEDGTQQARRDSSISIGLGGLVSVFILSTAASALFQQGLDIGNAVDMARAIEPVYGEAARFFIGVGLTAAGLTSAITAPLATAYALSEMINRRGGAQSPFFRNVSLAVLLVGTGISLLGIKPVSLILLAQYANGLLLPLLAAFLLYVMNRRDLLGDHRNSYVANIAGGVVLLVTLSLGLRSILRASGIMP